MKNLSLLLVSCALVSCVDTDLEDGSTSGPISITPATWTTRPGKVQEFVAEDVDDPSAPIVWMLPGEVDMVGPSIDQGRSILVASKGSLGALKLQAASMVDPLRTSEADITIVDFGFGFQLAQEGGFPGDIGQEPSADIALSRKGNTQALALGPDDFLFFGYLNPASGENYVKVFDETFTVQQPPGSPVTHQANYDVEFPARITADANGFGYWVDVNDAVNRVDAQGARDMQVLANLGYVGSCLVDGAFSGTDIASNDDGDLYLFLQCVTAASNSIARVSGLFSGTPTAVFLADVSSPADTELVVDERGRLLFTDSRLLRRIASENPLMVETVADLNLVLEEIRPGEIVNSHDVIDLEVDSEGAIYVDVRADYKSVGSVDLIVILNAAGSLVRTIEDLPVSGAPAPLPIEGLLGVGVSPEGDLRFLHDITDPANPLASSQAAQAFAVDVGGELTVK